MVERPYRRAGSGQKPLLQGREWSGSPYGGPVVVGRPAQRARSGWEALTEGREFSRDPPIESASRPSELP